MQAWARFQVNPCEIGRKQNSTGTGFLLVLWLSPVGIIPPTLDFYFHHFFLTRIRRGTVINIHRFSRTVPVIIFRFLWNLNFLDRFSKTNIKFWKCSRWDPSCFTRTDRHDEANSRFSKFCEGGKNHRLRKTHRHWFVLVQCIFRLFNKRIIIDLYWFNVSSGYSTNASSLICTGSTYLQVIQQMHHHWFVLVQRIFRLFNKHLLLQRSFDVTTDRNMRRVTEEEQNILRRVLSAADYGVYLLKIAEDI